MDWQDQVRISGYAQFPDITPPALIAAAREAIDRIAVYFRIWFRDAESNERRWECLTNIWHGWKIKNS